MFQFEYTAACLKDSSWVFSEVPSSLSLLSSLEWYRLLKALLKSNRTIAVICPLSIALKMSSVTNKLNVSVECRDRFPLWCGVNRSCNICKKRLFFFSRLKISLFLYLYSFYHTNKRKKRKKLLTRKMWGMARTTELGSKLRVAVKKKIQIQTYWMFKKCPCPILTKSNTLVAMWCYVLNDILAKRERATWTNSLSTRTLLVHHDPSLSQNGRIWCLRGNLILQIV